MFREVPMNSPVEFSPAANLLKNRDRKQKRSTGDDGKFLSPIAPGTASGQPNQQTMEIPKLDNVRFKPVKTWASRIDCVEYEDEASTDKVVEMLELGRMDEATSYADTLYSTFISQEHQDIVALAEYLKLLTILRQWRRISHIVSRRNYYHIHLVFAHYAAVALFHRKLYEEVTDLPVGHLIPDGHSFNLPLKSPSQVTGRYVEDERTRYSFSELTELDKLAKKLNMGSALMLTMAESFLKLMNRDAAMLCIAYSVNHDDTPLHVERLMTKYNLVEPSEWEKYKSVRKAQLDQQGRNSDPKIMIEKAQYCYEMGKFIEARKLTDEIFENFGPHQECMLLRIHCLTMINDSRALLELGHQLVDDDPHVPLPWYCIAMYYYTIGANARARNFISKCTMMDSTFAEAWVAFGHILHYEVEHEQSMSCYYRASKLVDRSAEPFLYVSLQYSSHSQKLSRKFMMEAVSRSPNDPLLRHEEACIAFASKNYDEALRLFKMVLCMLTDSNTTDSTSEILKKKIDDFWRPMINNMGHLMRKTGRALEAILYHQKAIQMEPKFVDAIASVAICHAVQGDFGIAAEFFNRALAIDPFNETVRQCMSKMILAQKHVYKVDKEITDKPICYDKFIRSKQEVIPHSMLRKPNETYGVVGMQESSVPLITIPKISYESSIPISLFSDEAPL